MVSQAVAQYAREAMYEGQYGWVIDTDHEPMEGHPGDAGRKGPRNIPQEIDERLAAGEGRRFRMYDTDGILMYSGRMLTADPNDVGGALDFGPLEDFGSPNAGCTDIYYWEDDLEPFEAADQERAEETGIRGGYYKISVTDLSDSWGEFWYRTPIIRDDEFQTGGWVSL